MRYEYQTRGTCAKKISFDIENGIIRNVSFMGGCHGNLQAVSRLVEGKTAQEIAQLCSGIRCGYKDTSCGDQLAKAVLAAAQAEQEA
jgi:uncharacterized protein (TIGR03905 family)